MVVRERDESVMSEELARYSKLFPPESSVNTDELLGESGR